MLRMIKLYIPILIGVVLMMGCAQIAPPETGQALPSTPTIEPTNTLEAAISETAQTDDSSQITIKFAVIPWKDNAPNYYNDIVDWVADYTGYDIQSVQVKDYHQASELLASGAVDFAFLGAGGFVAAEQLKPGVKMLVSELYWNDAETEKISSYTSRFVVLKKNTHLNELADLEGKRFGFVDQESTSGFIVPNFLMKQQGIDYESFFEETFFLGNHEKVIDAVAAESIDAGTVYGEMVTHGTDQYGDIFKVILESPPIPSAGVAVHPDVPAEIQQTVQDAFVAMGPAELIAITDEIDIVGYRVEPDSFYDLIRDMEKSKQE